MKYTQFNPKNKDILTYGEALKPAMEITDQADADQYKAAYIEWMEKHMSEAEPGMTAEQIVNSNLGYFAGYYSNETRLRVEKLFRCAHPIFGKAAKHIPTNEEAFNAGYNRSI